MRITRPALTLALAASFLATGVASAAKKPAAKPVCHLVTDAKGDGTGNIVGAPGTPNDPAWDIVSADVASKGDMLTAVIRVDKLAKSAATSPTGIQWRMDFTVGGVKLFTQVVQDTVLGLSGTYGYVTTISNSLGTATPTLDLAKNEVRLSVPLSAFASKAAIKPIGGKLEDIAASAGRFYDLGAVTASDQSDDAAASKLYVTGSASCVAVGK